jgi:hypothetical protein
MALMTPTRDCAVFYDAKSAKLAVAKGLIAMQGYQM